MLSLRKFAILALAVAAALAPAGGLAQQPIDVLIALPAPTLTFSAPFLAEDAGLYKKEGLNVQHRMLVGVEAINAVISGSVDFTVSTGPVFLRAAAHGQRLLAIANLIDRPLVEMVLRTDVYDALHVTDGMSLAERGRLLKGKTIAIQGVGSIIHAWERFVAARGGLDPETDVRIAPMDPPAMLGALQIKQVDGFATSLPFTTQAVLNGSAKMFASAAEGIAPDLIPFPYGLLMGKPQTCEKTPEKWRPRVRARAAAHPQQAVQQNGPHRAESGVQGGGRGACDGPARDARAAGAGREGEPRGEAARSQGQTFVLRRALHRQVPALAG
jgi:NitT/TauT family transport system substrate-binding protein